MTTRRVTDEQIMMIFQCGFTSGIATAAGADNPTDHDDDISEDARRFAEIIFKNPVVQLETLESLHDLLNGGEGHSGKITVPLPVGDDA